MVSSVKHGVGTSHTARLDTGWRRLTIRWPTCHGTLPMKTATRVPGWSSWMLLPGARLNEGSYDRFQSNAAGCKSVLVPRGCRRLHLSCAFDGRVECPRGKSDQADDLHRRRR